jgi:transposase-like protein
VDSTGDTIDFLLSPKRDENAARRFFQKALRSPNHPRPRVINVDWNVHLVNRISRWNQ